jgi:integrase/recombinase XerD
VRGFYDFLVGEGLRESNPAGDGRYTARNRGGGGHQRGLIPRLTKLPWIPTESQWLELLAVAAGEPARNRVMLALAYDAALRREELCSLRRNRAALVALQAFRLAAETFRDRPRRGRTS